MKQANVLLIEDTDSVREVLKRQIEALGVSVTALPDGERVKSVLDKTPFDLVIADLQLPDCSGVDIARFARAKNCRVILLSGEGGLGSRLDVASAGFEDVLSKPISLEALRDLLVKYGLLDTGLALTTPEGPEMDPTGVLDLRILREQMGELDESAIAMLSKFPQMMKPLVLKIANLAETGATSELAEVAHSLKGAARSAGAVHLGELCAEIQSAAAKGVADHPSCHELQTEFLKVETAISRLA